jgi:hypothetical protein
LGLSDDGKANREPSSTAGLATIGSGVGTGVSQARSAISTPAVKLAQVAETLFMKSLIYHTCQVLSTPLGREPALTNFL